MEARDRSIKVWCNKIQQAEIKLPRFQRLEAWDRGRIRGLLSAIIHEPSLPMGITLIMEVGAEELFESRYLKTAEPKHAENSRVMEHLLDGQQRLTALWRMFHNNYEKETYYVYVKEFDEGEEPWNGDANTWCEGRYERGGKRCPRWCESPEKTLRYGLIPTQLLNPLMPQQEIDNWVNEAVGAEPDGEGARDFFHRKERVKSTITNLRAKVEHYNIPHLSLPSSTDSGVALGVFINMNTNNKPLSVYDIVVAQLEAKMGMSLHDMQEKLEEKYKAVGRYGAWSRLILNTSSLLQGKPPNQKGARDLNMDDMAKNWSDLELGVSRMATFLQNEKIYDESRLPTSAVLPVISALYRDIPESGDVLGKHERLLKKYLWRAFFTRRYESAAATNAFADFKALRAIIRGKKEDDTPCRDEDVRVPIFENPLPSPDELRGVDWPKGATILGRAILAIGCKCGAKDFATGEDLTVQNISGRQYHHIFPKALLDETGLEEDGSYALNCALIAGKTNAAIGAREPLQYLQERYKWASEDIVRERLHSHLIPYEELSRAGGYDGLSAKAKSEKMKDDLESFLSARAKLIACAVKAVSEGRSISAPQIFKECQNKD